MDAAAPASLPALQSRIGWLCQSLRFAALAYPTWIFVLLALHWSNADDVTRAYSHWLKATLVEVPAPQRVGGFLIQMIPFALTSAACWNLWRLFSGFLAGRVFTLDAALTLRRLSLFGLAAVAIDLVSRPALSGLMSIHMPPGSRYLAFFFQPHDLLDLMFLGGLLALAQVFKVAAELAEDHAAIV
ncbi:MAG: DUF2975 domain-containing protein [Hyphomicrobiales bacterium]|nr:DUF2975 domain-containing protein [Hyphomicrobiales bacterium]